MMCTLYLAILVLQVQTTEPTIPADAVPLLQAGIEAEKHHDLDLAISDFRRATTLAPSAPLAFIRLGEAYVSKQDYSDAIAPLKRALELAPDSLSAHQLLGFALLTQGYASEAIPHLELVHEYGALGIAQLQVGLAAEAVSNLRTALVKRPNDPDLLYYLSQAGSELSSQSKDKLLSDFRASARGHQAMGQHYYQSKMFPEAIQEYEQAIALRPDLPGLRLELGQVYAANSQWEKAEEQFRLEAKIQPGNGEAAYRFGEVLLQEGKMQEAITELRRSDELRSDMPETLYSLGKAEAVSDPAAAEHALTRVIQLEKDSPLAAQAYFTLAGIHRKQGKIGQAAQETAEFRRLQASNSQSLPKQ